MIEQEFKSTSIEHLVEYLKRIESAISDLTLEQVWWQPHENSLSIGTILRHLNGNVTQWIISGIGGYTDNRNRSAEFNFEIKENPEVLISELRETIKNSNKIISEIPEPELLNALTIQGFSTTTLKAVYHVVEHFSWHTGQITLIAKQLKGINHGIAFYDDDKLNEARNSN